MRCHPRAPAVAGFAEDGECGAFEIIVGQRGGEGVTCADGVADGGRESMMAMRAVPRDEKAALAAHGDTEQMHRIAIQQKMRAAEKLVLILFGGLDRVRGFRRGARGRFLAQRIVEAFE